MVNSLGVTVQNSLISGKVDLYSNYSANKLRVLK